MGLADIMKRCLLFCPHNPERRKHMNKEAMQEQIMEALSKKLGDGFHLSIQKVLKTNRDLDGLVIMAEGETLCPTVYLEPFYDDMGNGADAAEIAEKILRGYSSARMDTSRYDVTSLHDFNYVKDRLYIQLVNRHFNQKLLEDAPHAMFLDDFALTARCSVDTTDNAGGSFLVTDEHLSNWPIDCKTLLSHALQNTRKMFGIKLMPIEDLIGQLCPYASDSPSSSGIWVMTNSRMHFGAATVLFDDLLKNFAEKHGSFYVIFSSVHEVMLMPMNDKSCTETLTRINQTVNANMPEIEILGTKAYCYCKDKGFVLQDGQ